MRRRTVRVPVALLVAAFLTLGPASVALAHGEQTIELGSSRVQPGGAIEVRADLGSGESFEIALVSTADGSRRVISTVGATEEGHFQGYVTVPADVLPGDYLVEASADLLVARVELTVAGAPIPEGGALPGRDEGLAEPVTIRTPAPKGTGPSRASVPAPAVATTAPSHGLLVLGIAVIATVAMLVGLRLLQPGRPPVSD